MSTTNSLIANQSRAQRAIAGIQKDLSTTASLNLAGTSYTPAQLIALLQAYVDQVTALAAVHAQLHDAVNQERTQRTQILAVLLALQSFVTNLFGAGSTVLGDFGFTPKKVGTASVATKAQALVKSKATRVARHTMGKKEKLSITGDPPASPAPAPAATNGATVKM